MEVFLIQKHYEENFAKLVKRWAFRAGSNEAGEDIVQTAYERAIRYRKSCDPARFDQWFSKLLVNSFKDFKSEERGYTSIEEQETEEETTDCTSFPSHIVKEIYDLINTKSSVQIEVLTMHFKHGYSAIDISKQTDYSYAKCHQIIQRFRNEIKELYK